jgi:hypothetical protein
VTFIIFNTFFFCTFLLSTAAQYNDPDPFQWMGLYLLGALMCLLAMLKRQIRCLPPFLVAVSFVWAAYLLPEIVGQVTLRQTANSLTMQTHSVEEAREVGGLLFVAFWAVMVWAHNSKA